MQEPTELAPMERAVGMSAAAAPALAPALVAQLRHATPRVVAYLAPVAGMRERRVTGSGVVVRLEGKLRVLVPSSLVAGAVRLGVAVAGSAREVAATLAGDSGRHAMAVLDVGACAGLAPLPLGRELGCGQPVVALGYAGGLSVEPGAAYGAVTYVKRMGRLPREFEHTAPVVAHGGPVADQGGHLVGITVAGAGPGVRVALPAERVVALAADLITSERRDWLGLRLAPYQHSPAQAGLLVESIEPGSPAARAGFRVADLLLAVQDTPVACERDLYEALSPWQLGDTVFVLVRRLGEMPQRLLAGVLTIGDPSGPNRLAPLQG